MAGHPRCNAEGFRIFSPSPEEFLSLLGGKWREDAGCSIQIIKQIFNDSTHLM